MQETWVWFLGQEDPLEKEIAICSSILAWKTPWIEEPGQLQSMGSQKVEHDWACSQGYALGFPDGSVGKESICNAGDTRDLDSIPGSGRSPGEGNGNPLQYSCLKNPMDGDWWATVQRVTRSWTQLSIHTRPCKYSISPWFHQPTLELHSESCLQQLSPWRANGEFPLPSGRLF